jgi:hypothetical protein
MIVYDEVGFDAVDKYVYQLVINNLVLPPLDSSVYSRSQFSHTINIFW